MNKKISALLLWGLSNITPYVLFAQLKVISLLDGSSYQPLKDVTIGGIVMVRHAKPGSDEQLVEPVAGV